MVFGETRSCLQSYSHTSFASALSSAISNTLVWDVGSLGAFKERVSTVGLGWLDWPPFVGKIQN